MDIRKLHLLAAIFLFGGAEAASAQDAANGARLSQRWCSECHAIGSPADKSRGIPSFAAIATKDNINADTIAAFLLLPHATMPNHPLSRGDARDIARFIMEMK